MSLFLLAGYGFVCTALYYMFPLRIRWIVLLLLSFGFYAARGLTGLPFILLTAFSTWLGALCISSMAEKTKAKIRAQKDTLTKEERTRIKAQDQKRRRVVFFSVLVLNFAILAVLKYADDLLGIAGASPLGLVLPLGISFYTFQSMGYLIDVYNGKYAPERNPAKFALFVSFFPQLIQGPIGRYDQLAPQLKAGHKLSADNLGRGFALIVWGLFKKLVIADRAFPLVETVFSAQAGEYGGAVAIVGVLFYSLQQYCDFSGGIDLVAGIAMQLGIELAPNFKRPYFAVSLGDFWRRWHISLGAWMRDYVFYPFALTRPVSRLSKWAKPRLGAEFARALPAALGNVLVFLLVGVWHGAASNYVLWGLYNGLILAFSALMEPAYKRFGARHAALAASRRFYVLRVLRTFVIVNIGWFFDRCARGADAFRMLASTVTDMRLSQLCGDVLLDLGVSGADFGVLAVSTVLLFSASIAQERGVCLSQWVMRRKLPLRWLILIGGVLCVLIFGVYGSGFSEASFIYYQF